jgi:hypothetical protein
LPKVFDRFRAVLPEEFHLHPVDRRKEGWVNEWTKEGWVNEWTERRKNGRGSSRWVEAAKWGKREGGKKKRMKREKEGKKEREKEGGLHMHIIHIYVYTHMHTCVFCCVCEERERKSEKKRGEREEGGGPSRWDIPNADIKENHWEGWAEGGR